MSSEGVPAVVKFQNENGSFNLDSNFAEHIGVPLEKLTGVAESFGWSENVWATSVALGYFNEKCQDNKSTWLSAGEKGTDWLKLNVPEEKVPEKKIDYILETGKNFVHNLLVSKATGPTPFRPLVNPNKIK